MKMIEHLTGASRELADYMSEISEEAYSAGWMDGLEYALWYAVQNGPTNYGRLVISEAHIQKLSHLSSVAKGWVYWHEENVESYIAIQEWVSMFEKDFNLYKGKIT